MFQGLSSASAFIGLNLSAFNTGARLFMIIIALTSGFVVLVLMAGYLVKLLDKRK